MPLTTKTTQTMADPSTPDILFVGVYAGVVRLSKPKFLFPFKLLFNWLHYQPSCLTIYYYTENRQTSQTSLMYLNSRCSSDAMSTLLAVLTCIVCWCPHCSIPVCSHFSPTRSTPRLTLWSIGWVDLWTADFLSFTGLNSGGGAADHRCYAVLQIGGSGRRRGPQCWRKTVD